MKLNLTTPPVLRDVEFDGDSWFFRFSDEEWLRSGCLWRLLRNGHISFTSNDHGQLFGLSKPIDAVLLVTASLAGKEVTSLGWDDETADLSVSLGDELWLQLVADSSGYEAWELRIDGKRYIAQGGGTVIAV
jgi:hypothetical protein